MRALVTGAGSGIGRATCLRLAREAVTRGEKAQIAAVDLASSPGLHGVAEELTKLGAQAIKEGIDRDMGAKHAKWFIRSTETTGWLRETELVPKTQGVVSSVKQMNVRATWLLAKAAHDALLASHGAIVITASMSGSNAHANLGAYGPSKAAVIMLMRVLAQEFGRDGIRVNAVSPGMVRTGMTEPVYKNQDLATQRAELVPIGRVATPEDIADAIAFLLGPDARYVNGHDLVVDGGVAGNFLGRLPGISQIPRG